MYRFSRSSRCFFNGGLSSLLHTYFMDPTAVLEPVPTKFRWSRFKSDSGPTYCWDENKWPIIRQAETKVLQNILHMNAGDGQHSYAKNSLVQETVILKTKPILEEAIKHMFASGANLSMSTFKVAELGCSSGPNALLPVSYIIDTVYKICQEKSLTKTPDFQIFLNDLPGNDFNAIFKLLPGFRQKLEKVKGGLLGYCFISGIPSSFYGRLFPSHTLHFVHSSYSIHWLSKIPDGLVNEGNIYIAENSPPEVFEAYLKQFQKDFFLLLRLRAEEMVSDGRMVLVFMGRAMINPSACRDWGYYSEMLTKSLFELAYEGLVEEADIDSFNVPFYAPHEEEVIEIVKMEGSFTIDKFKTFQINNDPRDDVNNSNFIFNETEVGKNAANNRRSVLEPILARHFGTSVMDSLFSKYAKVLGENWLLEKPKNTTIIVLSLKKNY